jgi:hypothetical protein
MANCCATDITLMSDDENDFTDKQYKAIVKDLKELEHCWSEADLVDTNLIEWHGDTRWNVPTDALIKIAIKWQCSIRAIGREDGCAFIQVVCIDESGELVQDAEIDYAL